MTFIRALHIAVCLAILSGVPGITHAQSGITGSVTDSTGGALPGVTVVASSPALLEEPRALVTDADGRYAFVDLGPGAYRVEFELPGFAKASREVQLENELTATIDMELGLEELQEGVTVLTGASVVDVRMNSGWGFCYITRQEYEELTRNEHLKNGDAQE